VEKSTIKSDPEVISNFMDSFTSANTSRYLNSKFTEIAQRIYQESIRHRKEQQGKDLPAEPPRTMLGA
jgi:hypothetical protein